MRVYADSANETVAAVATAMKLGAVKTYAAVAGRSAGLAFHWIQRLPKLTAAAYRPGDSEGRAGETMSLRCERHAQDYAHSTLYLEGARQTY